MLVMNTWFKKRKMKLCTWKGPGDRKIYQIDYIVVKQRFRNSTRHLKTIPGVDIDSDHNLQVAEEQTKLQSIKKAGNRKPKWSLERIKSKENHVKQVMEQKFSQIDEVTGSVEDSSGKVKETLLKILNNDIGKMEIAPRKPWITKAMLNKMEKKRIAKITNTIECRRLNNQPRREFERTKEICMEEICKEIMGLQKKVRYDLMYQKAQQL
jgi:hypothetical protein